MQVRVNLTNRYARFRGPYPKKGFRRLFGYKDPSAYFTPQFRRRDSEGKRIWDGIKTFLAYDRVPAGLFVSLRREIERKWDIDFKVRDLRERPDFDDLDEDYISDRKYQNACVATMRDHSDMGGIIINATGTGKTRIAGMYFKALNGSGVFIVDELGLLDQAQKELEKFLGERVGNIGNMQFKPRRITVATAQTLHRHRHDPKFEPWIKKLDVMIIDEIHDMLGKRNHEIVSSYRPKACFGLTATLQMKKASVRVKAQALTGPLIYTFPLAKGVSEKVLSPGIAVLVRITRGGYPDEDHWTAYDKMIAKSNRYNTVVEKLARVGLQKKKHIMLLVHRPKHVKILSKRFKDVPHKVAKGDVRVRDRILAKEEFESKKLKMLIANQVFKKGTNLKIVDMIIDAASRPSFNDAAQKYGRGVRLCDKKVGLLYFDIGFKNPPDVDHHSFNFNRFAKGGRVRKRSLLSQNIPVYTVDWKDNPKFIVKFAIRKLEQLVRSMK